MDEEARQRWMKKEFPKILKQTKQLGASVYFGDEASFALWGSLSYTWGRKGRQPLVKTTGLRKGYKVFGAIEFFSGQLVYQGTQERFQSDSYQTFLLHLLSQVSGKVILIQDGARYHTSKAAREFFEQHKERFIVYQLPSYSPDYNPIEYLWKNVLHPKKTWTVGLNKIDYCARQKRSATWQGSEGHSTRSSRRKWSWKSSVAARTWPRHVGNTV